MAYAAPSVTSAGLTIPSYTDIRDELIAQFQNIYGQDVYLANDSADYQWISVVALYIYDAFLCCQLAFNNRSPVGAITAALDSLVKLNGIARSAASYSTCELTVTGTVGTTITNGVAQDESGYKWDLPATVTLTSGSAIVTATCETIGAITAQAGTIDKISTPTAGWTGVTNASAATVGTPVESDSQLRARQAISVALPSMTRLDGTVAAIAALSGVTRYKLLENYANNTDANNLVPHSIALVVEGSTDALIAQAIYNNKGPGCATNGTTTVTIGDDQTGLSTDINFYRPSQVQIDVSMTVSLLTGGTSATLTSIQAAIVSYLNSLQIGQKITTLTGIVGAAVSVMSSLNSPTFSIQSVRACKHGGTLGTSDITLAFNEVAYGLNANVSVTSV